MRTCLYLRTLTSLSVIFVSGTFFLTILTNTACAQEKAIRFEKRLLAIDANEGIDVADLNSDGKLDVVAGRNWYAATDFTPRPLRLIEDWNGYVQSNGDFCFDVNRDGHIDIIAGSYLPSEVYWYENPGPQQLELGAVWKQHLLMDTEQSSNEASALRDLDNDGVPEWITNSWDARNPLVAWKLEYAEANEADQSATTLPRMKKYVIGVNGNSHGMGFGDINNDGREDILIGTGWYERPEGDIWSKRWKFHDDWEFIHSSIPMYVRDLNGDGLNDVIWGRGHEYGLYWWKSSGISDDGRFQYEQMTIDDKYSQTHTMHFADLDGDGRDELITGKRVRAHNGGDPGGKEMPCMYYYRWNDVTKSFTRYTIDEGRVGTGLQIRTADLNGDQLLDIAVAGKDGTWILFNKSDAATREK